MRPGDAGAPSAELTVIDSTDADLDLHDEPQEPSQEELQLPRYGTRGSAPGRRGCWAVTKAGNPCLAPRRGDGDFCNAHSGVGIGQNPKGFSEVGVARSAESRRRRADLRLVIGSTRLDTPRAALKALAVVNAERLAGRAVGAALSPDVPDLHAAKLALEIIETVDPKQQATLSLQGELDPESIATMGFRELLSFAQSHGIEPSTSPDKGLIEAAPVTT